MGEPRTHHFHDFAILNLQHYLSLQTPGYLQRIKKHPWNIFRTYYFAELSEFGKPDSLSIFEMAGTEQG